MGRVGREFVRERDGGEGKKTEKSVDFFSFVRGLGGHILFSV